MSLKSIESAKYYDKKASYDSRFRSHFRSHLISLTLRLLILWFLLAYQAVLCQKQRSRQLHVLS